ncbi:MAG: hypothetical protein M3145_01325, partial [Pseudomonadota bacterium]|nr:hypothetical protein [Pseudomonadota bacterium]
ETDPIQTGNGRGYLWYEVAGIEPARDRSFEEAREAVAARWREDEIRNRIKALADKIVEAVKSGKPFDAAVAEHGLTVQHSGAFSRTDAPAMLTKPGIEAVFATPEGGVGQAPATEALGRVVFRVARIETPPFDPKSPEADAIRRQIGNGLESDILAAYVARLRDDIGVTINQKALQTVLGEPSS